MFCVFAFFGVYYAWLPWWSIFGGAMLRRKAYAALEAWKRDKTRQGLLVTGARQVGKTTLIREFAKTNYERVAEVNFFDDRDAVKTISGARDAKDFFLRVTALSRTEILPGNTVVFLDEIQECGDVLTWLKFLAESKDCDFMLSGSLLGLDSFDVKSLPVGFLQTLDMFPLTFEEFCWAEGIGGTLLDAAMEAVSGREKVPDYLHELLVSTYYRYLLVGGMPDAVQAFEDSGDLMKARNVQSAIAELYNHDVAKYVKDKTEARQIRMVYDAIPGQLNNQNKRFKYTRLGKNLRFANLETAFDWLSCAGVALPAARVSEPVFPLGLSRDNNALKLYLNDVGLLTSKLAGNVDIDILNRKSSINFGSVFENAAAQELRAQGFDLQYYNTNKFGEIDFVVQDAKGGISLLEIKSGKDYRRHSALSNLRSVENYDIVRAIVFTESNVECAGGIDYLPVYSLGMIVGNFLT
jgi:predicted AAA+ superfamily ATPase